MSEPTIDDLKFEIIRGDVFEKYGVDLAHLVTISVPRLAAAIVEVEEAHLNLDCLSDACNHPNGCPEYAIGCGDTEEIAAQYMRKDLVIP